MRHAEELEMRRRLLVLEAAIQRQQLRLDVSELRAGLSPLALMLTLWRWWRRVDRSGPASAPPAE